MTAIGNIKGKDLTPSSGSFGIKNFLLSMRKTEYKSLTNEADIY